MQRGEFFRGSPVALRSYQDLIGWKKSIALVTEVYRCTERFPRPEMYGLTSQIRRAAISIPSNIAEGQGRRSRGEFKQFLGNARGSVFELESQIIIARNLGYLDEDQAKALLNQITEVGRIINGLLSSLDRAAGASAKN
jgi:four helix bundle protein